MKWIEEVNQIKTDAQLETKTNRNSSAAPEACAT